MSHQFVCEFCGATAIQGVCTNKCESSQVTEADLAQAVIADWNWMLANHPQVKLIASFVDYFVEVIGREPTAEESAEVES